MKAKQSFFHGRRLFCILFIFHFLSFGSPFIFVSKSNATLKEPKNAVWEVHLGLHFKRYSVTIGNKTPQFREEADEFMFFNRGSGFFINPNHLITNFHVVDRAVTGSSLILMQKRNGKTIHKKVRQILKISGLNDLALLEVGEKVNDYLSLKKLPFQFKRKEIFQIIGYPKSVFNKFSVEYLKSFFNGDLVNFLNLSQMVGYGFSGGPVLSQEDEVVGVVHAGSKYFHYLYAISLESLYHFLNKKGENCRPLSVMECVDKEWKILQNNVLKEDARATYQVGIVKYGYNQLKQSKKELLEKLSIQEELMNHNVQKAHNVIQKLMQIRDKGELGWEEEWNKTRSEVFDISLEYIDIKKNQRLSVIDFNASLNNFKK